MPAAPRVATTIRLGGSSAPALHDDVLVRRAALPFLVAAILAGVAVLAVGDSLTGPPRWSPDGLFYKARIDQIQGVDRQEALRRAFEGPPGATLRAVDPTRSGDASWVAYNARFYERRVLVPLAGAALEPIDGERTLLDISIAGYVAAVLATFFLLLLRVRLPVAAVVALAVALLPALRHHSTFPLTDSWGLALETLALASGLLVLDRGPRWLAAWFVAIAALSLTRDSAWVLILGAAALAVTQRSRLSFALAGTAVTASLPAMIAFSVSMRELLGQMLNDAYPSPDATWSSIAARYPGAIVDFLQADGGFVRDGAWYSAAFLLLGVAALFVLRRGSGSDPGEVLLKGSAIAGAAYVLVVPVFSAFRIELVCVPMAAFGLALALDRGWAPAARRLASLLQPRARAATRA